MRSLDAQRILVIGGSAGMGRSTAEMAVDQGAAMVAVSGRDPDRLAQAVSDLTGRGDAEVLGRALAIEDRAAIASVLAELAPIDHLVLPGSTVVPVRYDDLTPAIARAAFDSKFWGPFWTVYDARPHLRRGGSIVLFSGVAAERPVKGYLMGAAINGAINALTRSLALELGPLGVRVNTIAPGAVLTPLWDTLHTPEEKAAMVAKATERLPVGRPGTAHEAGHVAIFLMTNGFVNGQVVGLDGGALSMV
jgi:NAD(P)-dependent dehydrogenase (short-subunit alcohol dehydrogenase family)